MLAALTGAAFAQEARVGAPRPSPASGLVVIPKSSQIRAQDTGLRAHTNLRFLVPAPGATPAEAPPYSGYAIETPASLACVYRLVSPIRSCNPNSTVNTPSGGSQTIAIVDAYDDPYAASDFVAFDQQFGLPHTAGKFKVVYASGTRPPVDDTGGWELEESLDIEYAHAMAPKAMIYLVEANSSSFDDLLTGVQVATNLIRCGKTAACASNASGKGEVSMSWGGSEFAGENTLDPYFVANNVVFLAAAGDAPGVIYPSASSNVISVGGTTTARSWINGNLIQEIAWSDAGGGLSYYEPTPGYQSAIATMAMGSRATPDVSAIANPNSGVWIYDSFTYEGIDNPSNWWIVGGTSVATPVWAGILNAASTANGKFAFSSVAELTKMYSDYANWTSYDAAFWDITYGACNFYSGSFSVRGYDLCTGLGSPKGFTGK
jgi:subtilase family serine protease